ncbi:hypothetical protein GCM10010112_46020 [Actinoplanes lobatus]|uniref:Uncharacterized protein n=1 Tax=Actinoplanes lobatus TaxID=113568 RepID=A0ABQ4ADE6_9ACTN|nr:hypothetical protein GCM10010112_46020 [Actinoplanes lobatus]GIE39025.1 hypothetical protein Alo02nite_19230 [Actinoplanes lobatus]
MVGDPGKGNSIAAAGCGLRAAGCGLRAAGCGPSVAGFDGRRDEVAPVKLGERRLAAGMPGEAATPGAVA